MPFFPNVIFVEGEGRGEKEKKNRFGSDKSKDRGGEREKNKTNVNDNFIIYDIRIRVQIIAGKRIRSINFQLAQIFAILACILFKIFKI